MESKHAAWEDSDDQVELQVETPKWARIKGETNNEKTSSVLQSSENFLSAPNSKSHEGFDFTLLQRISSSTRAITGLQFGTKEGVLMAASADKSIKLYEIIADEMQLLRIIRIKESNVICASIDLDERKIIFNGFSKNHFFDFDLDNNELRRIKPEFGTFGIEKDRNGRKNEKKGSAVKKTTKRRRNSKFTVRKTFISEETGTIAVALHNGEIKFFGVRSRKQRGAVRMNGSVKDVAFFNNGKNIVSVGDESEIYIWDVEKKICSARIKDESVHLSAVASTNDGDIIAVGNDSGVVNIYRGGVKVKSINNLVSEISGIEFNPQEELLLMFSKESANALRIVHLESMRVLKDWPSSHVRLGKVTAARFGGGSRCVVVGNSTGKISLFKAMKYVE